uniref:Uncharacterized protein n=1 Tax=Eutreptiella gymnastica TaxID=73025 RepID=A0A7S4GP14_9EUGL|mmetsp:Transcript_73013/g.123021  ORF Transcript_73013/g.123021 Transcript_73013/m.123021 type:complete len:210 (-) Transcript_73013:650-1279(-)
MKRCRDDPIFGPVPVYVVNEEQTAYAERIAKKFVANKIPAAVVPIHDRTALATQMQVLAEGLTFQAIVIHPRSEADKTVAFIGANIESSQIPAYEDLDPDIAIDFIQQQHRIAEDRQKKWYEQQEAKSKLRRKQVASLSAGQHLHGRLCSLEPFLAQRALSLRYRWECKSQVSTQVLHQSSRLLHLHRHQHLSQPARNRQLLALIYKVF